MMTRLEDLALKLINNRIKKARDLLAASNDDPEKDQLTDDGLYELDEVITLLTEYENNGTATRL